MNAQAAAMWASVVVTAILGIVGFALSLYLMMMMGHYMDRFLAFVEEDNPVLGRQKPTGPVVFRRLFCKHRQGYSHIKTARGRKYTVCNRCGADMNARARRMEDRV